METISNAAAAAAKAVWGEGETHREPVSGVKGDTSKGEPYDAGNLDTPTQEKAEETYDERGLGQETTAPKSTRIETSSAQATVPVPVTEDTRDSTAGQNKTRDPEREGHEHAGNADLRDVDNTSTGTGSKLGEGPGPKPLESVAKDNSGDAGRDRPQEGFSEAPREVGSESLPSSSEKLENQPAEEYVHATGFAADGGDFDATKPGAGREADRLMEQKATHLGSEGSSGSQSHETHSHSSKHKDKPSIGERIKAKLHKH
ncbi:hypothetical protein ACJ41O_011410 [Fusarium nematophilum]